MRAELANGDLATGWTAPGSSTVYFNFGARRTDGSLVWGDVDPAPRDPKVSLEDTIRSYWHVTGRVIPVS